MIQRIQSVYLLLVCILMSVAAISPIALIEKNDPTPSFTTIQAISLSPTDNTMQLIELAILPLLIALIALITIFLYKKRKVQIILCRFISLFILIHIGLCYLMLYQGGLANMESISLQYGLMLPVLALIFNIMGYFKIKADEKLVKSLDRIR